MSGRQEANMSDKEIVKETPTHSSAESHDKFVKDAYNFCTDTVTNPDARARQAFVAAYGTAVGGIKDLRNELIDHPWETIGKIAGSGASGIAIGAALASESPLIVGATGVAVVVTTTGALWNTFIRLAHNEALQKSIDLAYKSGDQRSLTESMQGAASVLGPEAANYGLALAGGLAGGFIGSKAISELGWNDLTSGLRPLIPIAYGTANGAAEMKFADGSIIHMHGGQAIYQIGGLEYVLKPNPRGINMSILGSIAGRQVIKSWHDSPHGELPKPFEANINPKLGVTKVTEVTGTIRYDHRKIAQHLSNWFPSCHECGPKNPNIRSNKNR